jgi:hypothetical protein
MTDSNDPCRNDCKEEQVFPYKINNRPGLSHIHYRIGNYHQIREALLRNLDKDPILSDWTHREPDDPGIALLESAAIAGDILTFYQELYANEAYLRTAQWRESIADLVRLTGYLLSPAVGGNATFAFEIKDKDNLYKPVTIPKGLPIKAQLETSDQAVDFETLDEHILYPGIGKFNLFPATYHPDISNGSNRFSIETSVLNRSGLQLQKGDRILLFKKKSDSIDIRQIVVIKEINTVFNLTHIIIEGLWQGGFVGQHITAYKIKRSFRHLGYNGPNKTIVVKEGGVIEKKVPFTRQVGQPSPPKGQSNPSDLTAFLIKNNFVNLGNFSMLFSDYNPLWSYQSFPLDQEVDNISIGTTFMVSLSLSNKKGNTGSTYMFERKVISLSPETVTQGNVTAGSTVILLNQTAALTGADPPLIYTDIRTVELHEAMGEPITLKGPLTIAPGAGTDTLYFYGPFNSYKKLHKRSIALVEKERVETATVTIDTNLQADTDAIGFHPLYLAPKLQSFLFADFPLQDPDITKEQLVTVFGNLVASNQGKKEKEVVLGNGDHSKKFQAFKLPKKPLTYHNQADASPPEVPELEIYVNDLLWTQVPVFFGRKRREHIYIVREDNDGNSWVQFGDGITGARLPSGIRNITARYRTGSGAYGPLKEGANPQPGATVLRLEKLHMHQPASGGSLPESGENARHAAPGKTQALGRLVSIMDFESEALAIAGVAKASASWKVTDSGSFVALNLLMDTGRSAEFISVADILNKYNICRGPQRFPVICNEGKRNYIYIQAQCTIDPSYKEANVKEAIQLALGTTPATFTGISKVGSRGLFGSQVRRFGQKAYASRIAGCINNVAGVISAKIIALETLGEADDPKSIALPVPPEFHNVLPCPGLNLFCLDPSHLLLTAVKDGTGGRC